MQSIICDIDGVILHQNTPIPGAREFIQRILQQDIPFLLLTNFPSQTPKDLQNRFEQAGINVPAGHFYTSAMATAAFLEKQEGRKAYVIGEGALTHALYNIGFTMTDINPDFVVVGETTSFNWEMIQKAAQLIKKGARFIATNPDVADSESRPACGALCAPIERVAGKQPFYVGKPSPWIMRAALNNIDAHSESSVLIGDTMHTDILAGTQAGVQTILVLTGYTQREDLAKFPYQPTYVFASVAEIDLF